MKMRKASFLLILILSTSVIFSCTHSGKNNIKIYLPVSENYSNEFGKLFLFTEGDSRFYYVFYVGDESDIDRHFIFTKGYITKKTRKFTFIDFLGREIFSAKKSKEDMLVTTGLFKGFMLMNCDTTDFIKPVNILLNLSKEKLQFYYCVPDLDVINIIDKLKYYESNNLIHKEFEIYRDEVSNTFDKDTKFIMRKNGSFEITYDNLPIRKGSYVNDSGYITFFDTIIPITEKSIILKDSTVVSLTLPCASILFFRKPVSVKLPELEQ